MLKLRKLEKNDLEMVMNWRVQEEVTKYMYTNPELDMKKQMRWFLNIDEKRDIYWIITFEGIDIGLISVNNIDYRNKKCSWGYYIGNTIFRGKGISRNLECNIYDYVFYKLKLNKLVSEVFEFNEKVVAIHQKFGSEIEGVLKEHILKNGQYYNVVTMGITKNKWDNIKENIIYDKVVFGE